MLDSNHGDCAETLLDMLCYELACGRIAPETRALLIEHMEECPVCRQRADEFMGLIAEEGCFSAPTRVH